MAEVTIKQYLTNIQTGLEEELAANMKALPEGFNKQRFVLNCISVLKDNLKGFDGIEQNSIITTLAKGAFLGLDFYNKECYAIPYSGKVQFQTDYKGEIKLAKRYSSNPIKDIYAKNVREGDCFEEAIEGGRQVVNFRPKSFNNGKIIGSFAIVVFRDGSMLYDTMSAEEIEKTRQAFSKAANSKAWKETPGEMYKKTVLRRLCKMIDLDFDNSEQMVAFREGSDFDEQKTVDVDFTEVPAKDPFEAKKQMKPEIEGMDIEEA